MTRYRKLTQAELWQEAKELFGDDPMAWAFRCPRCGDVATLADWVKATNGGGAMAGQECIGRATGALSKPPTNTRGCDWAAYGLFRGPWEIVMPATDGQPEHSAWSFELAAPAEDGGEDQ